MLKRRIFAASLASVLALSSFSVSAFAADESKAYANKADLEKLVKEMNDFKDDDKAGLDTYGEISAEKFTKALEYAENVLADAEATTDDYAVSYTMLKAAKDNLTIKTLDELKALLSTWKLTYDKQNILNEDIDGNGTTDYQYEEDSFSAFESAYSDAQDIADYEMELVNNTYSPSIPIDVILGSEGWLDIVDIESGEILYTTDKSAERTYSPDELDCIQDHGTGITIRSISFQTPDGSYNYFISKSYSNGTDTPDEYLLLSSDLKKLSGTMKEFEDKETFTNREFEFLLYDLSHEGRYMRKYAFTSRDGKQCYAVYLDANEDEVTPPWLFIVITIIGIVGILITALGFYIRYINKHVQRPINALGNAMAEFAKSNYREKLNYIGSKDFEQLVAAFNEMVGLLNASEEQRLALEQDRQRMLAGLSHDLKTPMTIIEGFAKAIRDGVVREEDKQKYLNLIIAKSEYMSELINEFYEYSKLDHPDFKLNTEPTDIVEFVRSFLAAKYDEFDIQGYEIRAELSDDRLTVALDREQFTRVLDNLVSNFFKYTPKGSTLTVGERCEDGKAKIYVMDNGGGIPEKARADIFAPFVVAEESRSKQGTGLGLTVCKKIVEMHGGTISLLDPDGQHMTIFEICIPMLAENNEQN